MITELRKEKNFFFHFSVKELVNFGKNRKETGFAKKKQVLPEVE